MHFQFLQSVNYGLIILLNENFRTLKFRDKLEKILSKNNIEYRRGMSGGGNQLRQPYIKNYIPHFNKKNFENVEIVHKYGYYIGNYPYLTKSKIIKICELINKI